MARYVADGNKQVQFASLGLTSEEFVPYLSELATNGSSGMRTPLLLAGDLDAAVDHLDGDFVRLEASEV